MPKVSVIIPVYRVEKYIERCAISLFEQTLNDIEYIFINDCTPDSSIIVLEHILLKYPHRKKQVKILNMPTNCGLPAVRRHGIIAATGDYLIHCDSDDWTDVDLYKTMYDAARKDDADIVICDVMNEYANNKKSLRYYQDIAPYPPLAIKEMYRNYFDMYTHNKLVRRTIYTHNDILPYEGMNMWEDNGLMYRIFYYSHKLVQIHGLHYHYNRCNENAITYNYGRKSVNEMIQIATFLTNFFNTKKDAEEYRMTVNMLQFCAKINLITNEFGLIREFKTLFPHVEQYSKLLDPRIFSLKGKIRLFFVEYHLAWLFILLFKLKNIIIK